MRLAILASMAFLSNNVWAQKFPVGVVSVQDTVKSAQVGVISSVAIDGGHGVQFSGISNTSGLNFNGLQLSNMIFNERAAIVYHFTPRYNIGASIIMSNSFYDNGDIKFNQNKYLARAFFGVRL